MRVCISYRITDISAPSGFVITNNEAITAPRGTSYTQEYNLNPNIECVVVTRRKAARLNNLQVNVLLWRECLITSNELYCI